MSDNASVHKDAFWMLCNERIGYGMSREVYDSEILKDCVIKVESSACRFQNVLEWEAWQRLKWTDTAKWFAPCEWISPNGSVLVMKKTERVAKDKYPEKMPVFLTDFKYTNYGLYEGRIVCHDYGTHCLLENGMTKRMRKVEWVDR